MTPEKYHQVVAQCVSLSFNEMRQDLERRLAIVLSRHLPKAVVINMAQEISKQMAEAMEIQFVSSGAMDTIIKKML